ncbi:MAG TPA: hypothetical protein VGB63_07950 [Pedobacter sp.]
MGSTISFVEVTYQGDVNKITVIPFRTMRILKPYWQSVSIDKIEGML